LVFYLAGDPKRIVKIEDFKKGRKENTAFVRFFFSFKDDNKFSTQLLSIVVEFGNRKL